LRVYFEGDPKLRPGFHAFLTNVRQSAASGGWSFNLIATRGTPDRDFAKARRSHPGALNVLIKDSEGDSEGPPRSQVPDVFLMVQAMEAWFLADPEALVSYYGQGFRSFQAPADVELVPKANLFARLKHATAATRKGEYHKTKHAPALLERLNPLRIRERSRHCEMLFRSLLQRIGSEHSQP
jgi:hypothetical protein